MAFYVEKSASANTAIVYPGKTIERDQMRRFRLLLGELVATGYTGIVFDFSETEHVYYRIADILSNLRNVVEQKNGFVMFTGMNPYLRSIFNFIGMTGFVEMESCPEML